MIIKAIKTKPIVVGDSLLNILDNSIKKIEEGSIVVITSKIVSICEGSVIEKDGIDKNELVKKSADLYLPPDEIYKFSLTIKNNVLIPNAGIDESNGNGLYILWPKNAQKTANTVRSYFVKKYQLKNMGVLIVDSKTTPLRWGVTGVAIAHSGFQSLNDYIGTKDIFGREFKVEKANVADAIAVSAVVVMGEGNEQTPIAIVNDIPFVHFQNRNPSKKELENLSISLDEDIYAPILKSVNWLKSN